MTATKTMRRPRRRGVKIDIRAAVRSWLLKDDAVKKLSTDKEVDRKAILAFLQEFGAEDENGHYWINWPDDPVEGRVKGIKAEKHVTRSLNSERTEEYLKGRKLYSQCTETIVTLSEEKVLGLNFKGTITDADLEDLYDVYENYHFVPQRVKL
jgi:hypothetical protein